MKIEKPWGYEVIWAQTENYIGKILYIESGHRLSKQYHQTKEETVYVIAGVLYNYDKDNKLIKIKKGESFHVRPHQIHRFSAVEGPVVLAEVSTPQLDDIVRIDDDYNRN